MSKRKSHMSRYRNVALTRHRYITGPQYDSAPDTCAYCGLRGSITDGHVIPVSGMAGLLANQNLKSWIVPCCHECNMLVNSRSPYSIKGSNSPRNQFLRKRKALRELLEKRYITGSRSKGCSRAIWTESELANSDLNPNQEEDPEKISYRLARMIRSNYTKEEILRRMSYNCFSYW